jgi:hypothetical protein
MPSLKRIRELANEYLGFRYPKSAGDRLEMARFDREADTVSEFVAWMEADEWMAKIARKQQQPQPNKPRRHGND